ncbi:MAG TPA: ABC transporter substrate-binding protein [Candidatus Limnocylindria bacterium]|nr:ABC transporter substrate-binding protein [Candidatus Limnocylindria bacterium]
MTKLTVGLGYIPSVQFAQFYRAKVQGYYAAAGLDVTFQNGDDANLITSIALGTVDIGLADGTSVIPAVGQDIPVRYVATMYAKFPNVVISGADSGIASVADLRGRSIGIPGAYGSSWIMLQALLMSEGMTTADIIERDYPDYGQGVALQQGQVDAATGYRNNEPVQLGLTGFETIQFAVDDIVPLPGPGLIVGTSTLVSKRDALRAFVAATLRAMREITDSPEAGLDDAIVIVPDLANDRATQMAILNATIEMWQSDAGLGAIDEGGWNYSLSFMEDLPDSNIPDRVTVDDLITTELLP